MFKLALSLAILALAQAQLVSKGPCSFLNPAYQPKESANVLSGYEIRRINNNWNTGNCASWNVTPINDSLFVTNKEVVDRKLIERNATSSVNSDLSLSLTFRDFSSNFTFIGTGSEYIILYACSNQGANKQEYSWVLGIKTTLSESAKTEIQNILSIYKLSNANWVEISHTEESCKTGGAINLKTSPIIIFIVGFVISIEL